MGFPLLQKPREVCVGRQIKVLGLTLGSYWKGHMSNEESNSLYKCTVREYHPLHMFRGASALESESSEDE